MRELTKEESIDYIKKAYVLQNKLKEEYISLFDAQQGVLDMLDLIIKDSLKEDKK